VSDPLKGPWQSGTLQTQTQKAREAATAREAPAAMREVAPVRMILSEVQTPGVTTISP